MMRARHSLGQHFLVDVNIQRKIIETLDAGPDDEVLEIGPGTGTLTRHLAGSVRHLVAIELDDTLVEKLQSQFVGVNGVEIVHGDVLEQDPTALVEDLESASVVGNLPYNITTPALFWLLERRPRPARIVAMVQREVADRISAAPGGKTYGALSVGIRSVAAVERAFHVGRGSFRPVPDVDSSVLVILPFHPPPLTIEVEADLRSLVRESFARRRKQMQKILRSAPDYALDRAALTALEHATNFDLRRRPETFAPDEFIRLARELRRLGYPIGADAKPDTK